MEYICHDLFMIRTPALPVKISRELVNINNYNEILDYVLKNNLEGYFKEALQVSSYSLYEALQRRDNDSKKDKGIYMSLYKYLQRASSRTTPYGLLANVCMGNFTDSDESIVNLDKTKKSIKVDNFWAFNLIKDIEKDFEVLKNLSLIWNSSCYISDCRVRNPHFSDYGTAEGNSLKKNSSIRYTNLISILRDNTQEFVNYMDIVHIVQHHYPNVDKERICNTINTLIEQEYLFTDLRVPAYCEDVLEHILQIFDKYDLLSELKYKLEKIENDFKKYELPDKGDKEQLLNQILEQMKTIKTASNYIEVNSGSRLDKPFLSKEVKLKLEKFISVIANIGVETEVYTPLAEFKKQFQEEYGTNIEVPLTEIIDPCGFDGLRYYEDTYHSTSVREDKIKDIFEIKVQEALINREKQAILTKEDFIGICDENISDLRFQNSFDMNFIITKGDEGIHLTIGPNFGSTSAGKTFQRFYGVFDEDEFEKYNTIYDKLDKEEECLYVELREMPNYGRHSNVINWNKNYKYFLTLGLPGTIERESEVFLSDLTVGIDSKDNLYLKSISKNKICKMVTNNMLNPMINSKVFNLLLDISSSYDGIKIMDRMDNFLKNEYIYSPKIIIEDVTVAPAKWKFTEANLKIESLQKFKKSFDFCSKRYDVDEYFYMCNGDQRLLLHRTDEIALEILYQEFKEKKYLKLCSIEKDLFNSNMVINTKQEAYVSEFVFSFYIKENKNLQIESSNILLQNENRIIHPFQEGWVYLKIYCNKEMEDDFLVQFFDNKESLKINKFFFLRYADETGMHIRLRIKYSDQKEALKLYSVLNQWLCDMRDCGMLKFWSINEYRRENNRYGGADIISEIENLFFQDSEYVINFIKSRNVQNEEELETVYFEALSKLLCNLTLDKKKMLEILDKVVEQKNYRKEYSKKRKKYMKWFEEILVSEFMEDSRRNSAKNISDLIFNPKIKLTNSADDIILSIMHMCCNRLSGDRIVEKKMHSMLRHTLYDVIKKEKYY